MSWFVVRGTWLVVRGSWFVITDPGAGWIIRDSHATRQTRVPDVDWRATITRMDESISLVALFASSFLAATLLPGGSEAVLFGVLRLDPQQYWPALAVATLGNTLGGMSSYLIGRIVPQRGQIKGLDWIRRYGSPTLLLAWVPIIGDPLCVAAGWLRVNPWLAALFMALGKFARYLVIAALTL